jgi:hypothetical protein
MAAKLLPKLLSALLTLFSASYYIPTEQPQSQKPPLLIIMFGSDWFRKEDLPKKKK